MSLKECHLKLKWNVTENGMSLKMEYHSKLNVTQKGSNSKWNVNNNGMSLKKNVNKTECQSKRNLTPNVMSSRMECCSQFIVTQNILSLKMECHSLWNFSQN